MLECKLLEGRYYLIYCLQGSQYMIWQSSQCLLNESNEPSPYVASSSHEARLQCADYSVLEESINYYYNEQTVFIRVMFFLTRSSEKLSISYWSGKWLDYFSLNQHLNPYYMPSPVLETQGTKVTKVLVFHGCSWNRLRCRDGFMGVWPVQSYRALHWERPHVWFNALLKPSWNS